MDEIPPPVTKRANYFCQPVIQSNRKKQGYRALEQTKDQLFLWTVFCKTCFGIRDSISKGVNSSI